MHLRGTQFDPVHPGCRLLFPVTLSVLNQLGINNPGHPRVGPWNKSHRDDSGLSILQCSILLEAMQVCDFLSDGSPFWLGAELPGRFLKITQVWIPLQIQSIWLRLRLLQFKRPTGDLTRAVTQGSQKGGTVGVNKGRLVVGRAGSFYSWLHAGLLNGLVSTRGNWLKKQSDFCLPG